MILVTFNKVCSPEWNCMFARVITAEISTKLNNTNGNGQIIIKEKFFLL